MANYFVSSSRGSDSTGTGTASNPWASIGKAIGTTPAITLSGTGDALYIEPGIYRETVALGLSPTLAGPLSIIGDGDGAGFAAGGYATPATGLVDWRGWSDETTLITAAEFFTAFSKSYVTVKGIKLIGGGAGQTSCFNVSGAFSDWTFEDCIFVANLTKTVCGWIAPSVAAALNVTFRRCDFVTSGSAIDFRLPVNASEYDTNALVQNCRFFGVSFGVRYNKVGGTGTGMPTGLRVQNCSFYFCGTCVRIDYGGGDTVTTPSSVRGCNMQYCSTGVFAGNTSQLVEDGNLIYCGTARSSVSIGANSITSACPAFDVGDGRLSGVPLRPFGEPSPASATTMFGNYGTVPSVDLSNRPRPEGYGVATAVFGAMERHDTATVQSTQVQAGTSAQQLGPGQASQEWLVPVGATATTLTIYTRSDTNYGTATPPVFEMDAEPQRGVSSASATAPANTNTWNQLTIGPFTPSSAGYVKVRVRAVPAASTGICFIDTFGGSTGDPSGMELAYRGIAPRFLSSATVNTTIQIFNSEC